MVKLSVIIPVYNEKKTILELVDRVKAVKINKEIILVDDLSKDGTRELLKKKFSKDKNVLSCLVFGSYAREAVKESSDIDLLFVVKRKDKGLLKKCSHLSTLLGKEINPLVFNEKQFKEVLRIKEPAITSLLEPSQRLIILGREYFLKLENI